MRRFIRRIPLAEASRRRRRTTGAASGQALYEHEVRYRGFGFTIHITAEGRVAKKMGRPVGGFQGLRHPKLLELLTSPHPFPLLKKLKTIRWVKDALGPGQGAIKVQVNEERRV